jgi:glycosyltransferase involved in cell wall biosynthesis
MLSIIIPTYNEEQGIAKTICSIPKSIRNKSEVLVIDISDDMTPVIAKELGAKVIKTVKKGKGWQMREAAKKAKGDTLIFMDGDGTDPGQYIPQMLLRLKKADLVLGCRAILKLPKTIPCANIWPFGM